MDTLTDYRPVLRRILREYAEWSSGKGITAEVVEDPTIDHFELIRFGWVGVKRIHGSILHVDIVDGKLWIQHDGTNRPLAEELVAAGVPHDRIVLGYKSPRLRAITDYAVA